MSKFKIELTENGVSILAKKQRTLFDADGNEVVIDEGNHRGAIGLGDFPDLASFQAAVAEMIEGNFGKTLADGIADIKAGADKTAELTVERDTIQAEKDAIEAERVKEKGDKDKAMADLAAAQAEVASKTAELEACLSTLASVGSELAAEKVKGKVA